MWRWRDVKAPYQLRRRRLRPGAAAIERRVWLESEQLIEQDSNELAASEAERVGGGRDGRKRRHATEDSEARPLGESEERRILV